MKIMNLLVKQN